MVIIYCKRCKYEWNYKGNKKSKERQPRYTTCPMCHTSIRIPN